MANERMSRKPAVIILIYTYKPCLCAFSNSAVRLCASMIYARSAYAYITKPKQGFNSLTENTQYENPWHSACT